MLPLSEARQASDRRAEKIGNLVNLVEMLLERGVQKEWIEEVLGWRLET